MFINIKPPPGQINLGTHRGFIIEKIASQADVKTIVEIGTWNGCGSTRCVLEAMRNREDCSFYTLEVNKEMYKKAIKYDPQLPHVHFINGRIIEVEDFVTSPWPRDQPLLGQWLPISIREHEQVENVLDQLPEVIDFLILDGGEFSTRAEWEILRDRTKYVFLDDTAKLKNKANRKELINSSDFETLIDIPQGQQALLRGHGGPEQGDNHCGWSVFMRKEDGS